MKIAKRITTNGEILTLVALIGLVLLYALDTTPALSATEKKGKSSGATVIELTEQDFIEKVYDFRTGGGVWRYKGDKPAIIDFYAVWCGPCKRLRPRLEQLASEYGDDLVIYSIDAESAPELSRFMGIRAFPTLFFVPMSGMPTMAEGLLSLKVLREQADIIKVVE